MILKAFCSTLGHLVIILLNPCLHYLLCAQNYTFVPTFNYKQGRRKKRVQLYANAEEVKLHLLF